MKDLLLGVRVSGLYKVGGTPALMEGMFMGTAKGLVREDFLGSGTSHDPLPNQVVLGQDDQGP